VAWRTDKWTAINQGTTTVSYKEGKLPGQKVEWGIRYANWVTLQGVDGHVISVISAHLAPDTEITHGLQEVGITNLGILANQLAASGPVLMAGDMNFHYNGALQYPRELLTSYLMLRDRPELGRSIRAEGRATAKRFAWPRILEGYESVWETAFALTG